MKSRGSLNNAPATLVAVAMNTTLWGVQVLRGVFFSLAFSLSGFRQSPTLQAGPVEPSVP